MSQSGQKPTSFMTSLTKKRKTKTKNLFFLESKTYRVFRGFEQLSSTIGWGAMQLVRLLKYARF